jgi:hypothetical protein
MILNAVQCILGVLIALVGFQLFLIALNGISRFIDSLPRTRHKAPRSSRRFRNR